MYVLSGLAGTGKSTVAYTIARALHSFSREMIPTSIMLKSSLRRLHIDLRCSEYRATTKGPQEQLASLILEPLRIIVQSRVRPILVVVDALDECDGDDERAVVKGAHPGIAVIDNTSPAVP
ncbi:hypothetical protein M378DRAFT_540862 [Amanita muscaria Koide BX008]|uniref:Nephrocystin 3-like N-terminal domain-containing protein n=1 Tax=Amanita muscaria (strain Koide BX008) TaxID=946122 RepID=A0A0C2SQ18_AMAMK|nr:hypothetical protein M378DRAFT_540862 [Amanita muscaria Koide BX008]